MSKKIIWNCDYVGCSQQERSQELPGGWLSVVFYNSGKEYKYCFCSYGHLAGWSTKRNSYYKEDKQ